jgi:protein involved in polysaccharide export with SLBB domain
MASAKQSGNPTNASPGVSKSENIIADDADSASEIISTLRANPSLLLFAKEQLSQFLHSRGENVRPSEISDAELYRNIDEHTDFTELLRRGMFSAPRVLTSPKSQPLNEKEKDSNVLNENRPRIEVPSAYASIPALRDLYSQNIPAQGSLERFGMTLFKESSRSGLSMDNSRQSDEGPVSLDYVLGSGDLLNIELWGGLSRHLSRMVDTDGRLTLPDSGPVLVAGKTILEAQQLVRNALSREYKDIKVDLSLARLRNVRVYVVGEVAKPGMFFISGNATPIGVLLAAGGPTETGSLRRLRQMRGNDLVREIDLYDFLLEGRSDRQSFQNGDTLLVPTVGPQVTVVGSVRRPAIYEILHEMNLQQVLTLAGGVPVAGTLRTISVERIEAHENKTTVTLRSSEQNQSERSAQVESFKIQDGDRITIQSILPYSEQTVYLQGHVFRPGKFEFKPGMTVKDLVKSYQDLLPEPSDRAEIIRLSPPDYRPTIVTFDLLDVLRDTGTPVALNMFDTVRIYGRYERDAPSVSVEGEVQHPGEYPLADNMTAADLVRLAGGFKRSAYTKIADLSSHTTRDGTQVIVEQREVMIGEALAGISDTDVLLHPGDVLSIRQVTGWSDIGAVVVLRGEVNLPGSYGIEPGERLSSVLKRASGFRPTAYPPGTVFTRIQVRDFAERSRQELARKLRMEARIVDARFSSDPDAKLQKTAFDQTQDKILSDLVSQTASGRLVVSLTEDINSWENTPADIELRAGDEIVIPKRPEFVLITGQVYNPAAITYAPGKKASWYLARSGGASQFADKKRAFVIRANGEVVGDTGGFWAGGPLEVQMQPGDSIVIPAKIPTGSSTWKNLATTAQIISALAISAAAVASF